MKTRLILVGGFLGAGKTTLLAQAADLLTAGGNQVGLITNDQAPELVDTVLLSQDSSNVAEVSGSCFCCNFPGLLDAMSKLKTDANADILIAEPVGSCTDLSATIVQPLRDLHQSELAVAPLSVLVDPIMLRGILDGGVAGLHPSAAYIFRKQMEEADILVINKTDLVTPSELGELEQRVAKEYPLATICAVSARTGEGIDEWLAEVTSSEDAGRRLLEVDYDIYAEGEAVLGWLNATLALTGPDVEWRGYLGDLLAGLGARFESVGASIGHVKLLIDANHRVIVGNLTGGGSGLSVRGLEAKGSDARLTINVRVEMSPADVESAVRDVVSQLSASKNVNSVELAWRCLSPGRPMPTHRYDRLVALV